MIDVRAQVHARIAAEGFSLSALAVHGNILPIDSVDNHIQPVNAVRQKPVCRRVPRRNHLAAGIKGQYMQGRQKKEGRFYMGFIHAILQMLHISGILVR